MVACDPVKIRFRMFIAANHGNFFVTTADQVGRGLVRPTPIIRQNDVAFQTAGMCSDADDWDLQIFEHSGDGWFDLVRSGQEDQPGGIVAGKEQVAEQIKMLFGILVFG